MHGGRLSRTQWIVLCLALVGASASSLATRFQDAFLVGTVLGLVGAVVPVAVAYLGGSSTQRSAPTVMASGEATPAVVVMPKRSPSSYTPILVVGLILILLVNVGTVLFNLGVFSLSPGPTSCGKKLLFAGRVSDTGWRAPADLYASAQVAVSQYNDQHPDCTISLAALDTEKTGGMEFLNALQDPNVVGVIGPAGGNDAEPMGEDLNFVGLPFIVLSPAYDDYALDDYGDGHNLSDRGWKGFHRIQATGRKIGTAAAQFMQSDLGLHTAYIVYPYPVTGSFGDLIDGFRSTLGVDAVVGVGGLQSTKSFVDTVRSTKAAAVYVAFQGIPGFPSEVNQSLHDSGINVPVIFSTIADLYNSSQARIKPVDGIFLVCDCPPADLYPQFRKAYNDRFHREPDGTGVYAFDAANILLDGLAGGVTSRAQMQSWLSEHDYQGVMGTYHFTPQGDVESSQMRVWLYEARDGNYEVVKELRTV